MFKFIYMFHEAMAANMWPHQQQAKLVVVVVVVFTLPYTQLPRALF